MLSLFPDFSFGNSPFPVSSAIVAIVLPPVWIPRIKSGCSACWSWKALARALKSLTELPSAQSTALTVIREHPLPRFPALTALATPSSFRRQLARWEVSGHEDHSVPASSCTLGRQERASPLWTGIADARACTQFCLLADLAAASD